MSLQLPAFAVRRATSATSKAHFYAVHEGIKPAAPASITPCLGPEYDDQWTRTDKRLGASAAAPTTTS